MEIQLSIVSKLSLQEMAQRKFVIQLWNETAILDYFLFDDKKYPPEPSSGGCGGYYLNNAQVQQSFELRIWHSKTFRQVTEIVKRKVFELPLPISIKKQMLYIVKIIGAEILRWKISLHIDDINFVHIYHDINSLKQICWTSAGTVDYKKTAEKLMCLETLDIVYRFRLACSHYLVDHIPYLWEQLPAKYKNAFNKKYPMQSRYSDGAGVRIFMTEHVVYWFCVLNGLENKLVFWDNQTAFEYSAGEGNKAATEYYFQKLTDEERESSLQRVAGFVIEDRCRSRGLVFPVGNLSNILHYLLSEMSPAEQMEVFEKQPCHFLRCFLDWPWQDLSLDILNLAENRFSEHDYENLFSYITENIGRSGFYLQEIFQNFFLRNSKNNQKRFSPKNGYAFIPEFFFVEDSEPLLMILRNIEHADRVSLFTSCYFFESLDELFMKEKPELVEMYLRVAFQFIDKESLKLKFLRWLSLRFRSVELRRRKRKWKELYEVINEYDANTL